MYAITQDEFADFVGALIARTGKPVYGPVRKKRSGVVEFVQLTDVSEADFTYERSICSPLRDLLLPPEEPIYGCRRTDEGIVYVKPFFRTEAIVVGVHPYDIAAMDRGDAINGDKPLYLARRLGLVVIGLENTAPPPDSFCDEMGTARVDKGFDLMLSPCEVGYLVTVGSDVGRLLLTTILNARAAEPHEVRAWKAEREQHEQRALNLKCIADTLISNVRHPFFKKMGDECLGCGSCPIDCPTCTCFAEIDLVSLDGTVSERRAVPSSCHECEFSRAAGGHSSLPTRGARYSNWILCKFASTFTAYDVRGCVGCGRCIDACLVMHTDKETGEQNGCIASPLFAFRQVMKEQVHA